MFSGRKAERECWIERVEESEVLDLLNTWMMCLLLILTDIEDRPL